MIRKFGTALAVILCLAAVSLAAPAQAKSGVLPTGGSYSGMDHHGRTITFHFNGSNQISSFYVNSTLIGDSHSKHTAHTSGGAWHETCHNGYCTKGTWQTDFYVVGYWRGPTGSWTPFTASVPQPPHRGSYMGTDHGGADIHLTYNGTHVHSFSVSGHLVFPTVQVTQGSWSEVCSHDGWCYRGHFQGANTVVGEWRTRGSVWHAWEAYAYAS